MDAIVFEYPGNSKSYNVLSIRGLDDPDEFALWPGIQNRNLDGTITENIQGFQKIVTVEAGVIQVYADRTFFLNFLKSPIRMISFVSSAGSFSLLDPSGFENQWLYDCSLMRAFTVKLIETTVRRIWDDTKGFGFDYAQDWGSQF